MNWTNLLQTTRATILTGSWEQAENCWGDLKTDGRRPENLKAWIDLQVEILEKTQTDPLKNELRRGAIQQMYWQREASRPHLQWLKAKIESHAFIEKEVEQQARELVSDLEHDVPRK